MPKAQVLPALFAGNELDFQDVETCLELVHQYYAGCPIQELDCQGGCSWTLLVLPSRSCSIQPTSALESNGGIVQFRPPRHAIDITIARDTQRWYGHLAPDVVELGQIYVGQGVNLIGYEMSLIPGTRFSDVQPRSQRLDRSCLSRYVTLLESLADFYAITWRTGIKERDHGSSTTCTGRVGSTILSRLLKLERNLPSDELRTLAKRSRLRVEKGLLALLPVVLVHGDLLPSNIMIDSTTWAINGFVDWAEAEFLPFGLCFYAVEHLLGCLNDERCTEQQTFVFYEQAPILRSHFWKLLTQRILELNDTSVRDAVVLARDVGILLWHGIAFDDGKIDRVVEPERDPVEVAYLKAFLESVVTKADITPAPH